MVGAPLAGYLSDRVGRRNVILIGLGLMGPTQYAFTVVPNELILLPLIGVGIAAVMRQAITEVLVVDSAPAHRRATVLGSYYLFAQEISGLGAPVLGLLAGLFGLAAAYGGVSLAMAVLSVVVLVARRGL
jgi:MFS family permease